MAFSFEDVKQLREDTGCGIMDCKGALEKADGDFDKALDFLRKRGLEIAAKKGSRLAKEGRIESYVHMGNKIAVLLEVNCETDFVARNEDFCAFAKDVAMHIAAMNPKYIKKEDIPPAELSEAKNPDQLAVEQCLLNQPFVKDTKMTIQEYLNSLISKTGENIVISRFIRYKVGEIV